ncbi:pilus assembly PilX family protein [Aliikangiella marina]|nr:PilX N-terminal domain-containing pilus assembly protein [Aliikangiella marina]
MFTKKLTKYPSFQKSQQGAALFVALIMLLILTIVGLSASQRSTLQERMAANMHLDKMTFSVAESAISAFVAEANTGNKIDPAHVLFELRTTGDVVNKQYDLNGGRVASGFIDSNSGGGSLRAQIVPTILDDCDKTCGGFSLGLGSLSANIGCRNYLLTGNGQLVKDGQVLKTATTQLWAREITACN